MTFLATARVNYAARLQRAELLASRYPFAREILDFYRHVATFQQEFFKQLPNRWGKQPVAPAGGDLRSQLRVPLLIESFGNFLAVVERRGPAPLAAQARRLRDQGATDWTHVLSEFWEIGLLESPEPIADDDDAADSKPFREFFARAFLQPYAEFIAASMLPPVLPMTVSRCPRCNSLPLLGVLRPEGDGGKRFLQCSFCSQEWEFRRIFCAHCGEDQEQKLAVYVAEEFPHIRVEICNSCRYFLRTIDLTKDGNAVPIVDDLAAIPLGLWAHEHGYTRIQQNLLHT
jgi:formate dehydrogenase maturation protein FdhE